MSSAVLFEDWGARVFLLIDASRAMGDYPVAIGESGLMIPAPSEKLVSQGVGQALGKDRLIPIRLQTLYQSGPRQLNFIVGAREADDQRLLQGTHTNANPILMVSSLTFLEFQDIRRAGMGIYLR